MPNRVEMRALQLGVSWGGPLSGRFITPRENDGMSGFRRDRLLAGTVLSLLVAAPLGAVAQDAGKAAVSTVPSAAAQPSAESPLATPASEQAAPADNTPADPIAL